MLHKTKYVVGLCFAFLGCTNNNTQTVNVRELATLACRAQLQCGLASSLPPNSTVESCTPTFEAQINDYRQNCPAGTLEAFDATYRCRERNCAACTTNPACTECATENQAAVALAGRCSAGDSGVAPNG